MTWFRFYTDTVKDPKINRLSFVHRWLWVTVLSFAKESPIQGHLKLSRNVSVTFQDISDAVHIPLDDVQEGMKLLEDLDMLHRDEIDGHYIVTHWSKRQFVSDDSTSRVHKHREKKRADESGAVHVTLSKRSKDVSCNDIETPHITDYRERIKDHVQPTGYTPEFDSFWNEYPRHKEKQAAFKTWNTRLKERVSPSDLILAAINYANECRERGTAESYIKLPKTFLGPSKPYEDYLKRLEEEKEHRTTAVQPTDEEANELRFIYERTFTRP